MSRLKNILSHNMDANYFGDLYSFDKKLTLTLYKNYLRALCKKLREIGLLLIQFRF